MKRIFLSAVLISAGIACGAPYAQAASVDLEIESIQIQPPRPVEGTPLVAVASIRNNGSEQVENFKVSLEIFRDEKKIKVIADIPVLSRLPRSGSGLSLPVKFGKLPEGKYKLVMTVDSENMINESNETNNQHEESFEVWKSPAGSSMVEAYKV